MFTDFLVIMFMALINRVRGGGMFLGKLFDKDNPNKLPGRAVHLASLLILIMMFIVTKNVWLALIISIGYLFWGTFYWGGLFGLGRFVLDRELSTLDKFLLKISGQNGHIALTLRHLFVLPMFIGLGWFFGNMFIVLLAPLFAILATLSYELGWRMNEKNPEKYTNPILIGELLTGMILGLFIIFLI